MVAQIPLPWQLTDFLSAMGLGFLYMGVYMLLQRIWHRRASALPVRIIGVYGTPQQNRRRTQRRKRVRKTVAFCADTLYAVVCCIFTRAWVLTESRAAQLRWSMVVGVAVGCAAFGCGVLPMLHCYGRRLRRLTVPLARWLNRQKAKRHGWILAGRERRRLQRERHELRLQQKKNNRKQPVVPTAAQKNAAELEKSEQKRLQTTGRVYYNNL